MLLIFWVPSDWIETVNRSAKLLESPDDLTKLIAKSAPGCKGENLHQKPISSFADSARQEQLGR